MARQQFIQAPFAAPQQPVREVIRKDWFVYDFDGPITVAQGDQATVTFQIEADSDFELIKIGQFADIAKAAQTSSTRVLPLVTMQIKDASSGRSLFFNPIPIPALFGNGDLPHILPVPRMFKSQTTVQIFLENYSAATDYNMFFAFEGIKYFYNGR